MRGNPKGTFDVAQQCPKLDAVVELAAECVVMVVERFGEGGCQLSEVQSGAPGRQAAPTQQVELGYLGFRACEL